MFDDMGVTNCNEEAIELNSNVNVMIEAKKLRLSQDKCYKIQIAKQSINFRKWEINLKAHAEAMKSATQVKYFESNLLNPE
jgi:mevalonate pyrophosphate decarboxylase